jgi:aliphatic nitrilase
MGDTYPNFTVAAVQAASVLFDREKNIDKAVRYIEMAADEGAVIIGFPELFIPGHTNIWYWGKNSNPLPAQGTLFKELVKNAVKIPSGETDRLCSAAKKAHAYVVIGISELDILFPGTLYISQLLISDKGEILGVHRKLVPTLDEKLVYSRGDGSYLNVYDTSYGKLSALNCGEHNHDLYKYALLAMGTQIHVASWPPFPKNIFGQTQRDATDFRVRQFAREGQIFVINSCGLTDEQNIAVCCETQEEKVNLVGDSGGGSSIIGPNGEHLAGPMHEGEGVISARISLEDALHGKQAHNVLGHYTRWDVLSLNFNRERLSPFKQTPSPDKNITELAKTVCELRENIRLIKERVDSIEQKIES